MDRLLRPNASIGNDSQSKKFIADKTSADPRAARVSTFYLQKKSGPATYTNTREFGTRDFSQHAYNDVKPASPLMAARSASLDRTYQTPAARASVSLRDGHRTAAGSESSYAGNRPFLVRGKSQKSLDSKKKPMTIDDIRELLNKSK